MHFIHIDSRGRYWNGDYEPNHCYLFEDNWDDYNFRTTFDLRYVGLDGTLHEIGSLKIMTRGMESGRRVAVPDNFETLGNDYCSLGCEQNYYEQLFELSEQGEEILKALRDCVADSEIWHSFREEEAMVRSLLRGLSAREVEVTFRNIVLGVLKQSPFKFAFRSSPENSSVPSFMIDIDVIPGSTPPTNVHVLIGRNGVGKTRTLAGIVDAITESNSSNSIGIPGRLQFLEGSEDITRFANLVTVAFSAFDRFEPISETTISGNIRYSYVGLKKIEELPNSSNCITFKTPEELTEEFYNSISVCLTGPRRRRWLSVVEILNSDPGFAELQLDFFDGDNLTYSEEVRVAFEHLSSGHKVVLLTAIRLVELVDERTLVLIDEPESHLHPPLLSSFIRALSKLLITRNGVGIVATHSPVVLQEVPKSCVWVIRRAGEITTAERPSLETFAESLGILTREVFQLEVTESGFHTLLSNAADTYQDYDSIMEFFGQQIGSEGCAITRALVVQNNMKS